MITIRLLEPTDAPAMLDLHMRNKEFFEQFSPAVEENFYTLEGQVEKINKDVAAREADRSYAFGVFLQETGELIGYVSLAAVMRGFAQRAIIGYYLDQQHNGKGYMSMAVRMAVEYGFKELKLHRIEAGVMPHNLASIRVLEKAGFQQEGLTRKNVKINGKWEDHLLLAILNEDDEE